jgi:hypothetical protein
MRYARFYTATVLMVVMALNICKYQLPYIEYNLFRDYIAQNLCVKRFDANNDCQGQCFLNKQIELVNESDNSDANQTNKKHIAFDDYIVFKSIFQNSFVPKIELIAFVSIYIEKINQDVPVPPPKRFSINIRPLRGRSLCVSHT